MSDKICGVVECDIPPRDGLACGCGQFQGVKVLNFSDVDIFKGDYIEAQEMNCNWFVITHLRGDMRDVRR